MLPPMPSQNVHGDLPSLVLLSSLATHSRALVRSHQTRHLLAVVGLQQGPSSDDPPDIPRDIAEAGELHAFIASLGHRQWRQTTMRPFVRFTWIILMPRLEGVCWTCLMMMSRCEVLKISGVVPRYGLCI